MTVEKAVRELHSELTGLGAIDGSIIISSNVQPRSALGIPKNDGYNAEDPGVAVYWSTRTHTERVVACDRWDSVRQNVRAVGLAIHGLRLMERAGATQILDRAYQAFGALPPAPDTIPVRPWWEVFGFTESVIEVLSRPVLDARYKELAVKRHPDKGGTQEAIVELNQAYDVGKEFFA